MNKCASFSTSSHFLLLHVIRGVCAQQTISPDFKLPLCDSPRPVTITACVHGGGHKVKRGWSRSGPSGKVSSCPLVSCVCERVFAHAFSRIRTSGMSFSSMCHITAYLWQLFIWQKTERNADFDLLSNPTAVCLYCQYELQLVIWFIYMSIMICDIFL